MADPNPPLVTDEVDIIRAGCMAAETHLTCSYPQCTCGAIPKAIKAALAAARIRQAQGGDRGEEARRGIYVASRVRHAAMWQQARKEGTPIISSWIDEAGEGETADFGELWLRIQREATSAERLVFFAEKDDFPFKGALVEVGMALATDVPVFVVIDPDVELDGRTLRPLGSWAKHPNVTWASTLYDAFSGIVRDRKE